jgi:hypothetical protein
LTWSGGLAEWQEGDTVYLSIAFTWKLNEAWSARRVRAIARLRGRRRRPGTVPGEDAAQARRRCRDPRDLSRSGHEAQPDATFASRGCDQRCSFLHRAGDGRDFTLIPDFTPRPVLCDNNLSGLPADYQEHIIRRYQDAGVPLRDANSGFEPHSFTPDVYERWKPLVNAGGGPWRFAYDELGERAEALRVMRMLSSERSRRKRVYVLIGNEPYADCVQRIREVIDGGCEPHVQPYMKLVAMEREPHPRFDWTRERLKSVARWGSKPQLWRTVPPRGLRPLLSVAPIGRPLRRTAGTFRVTRDDLATYQAILTKETIDDGRSADGKAGV